MGLNLGSAEVDDVKLGSSQVDAIHVGTEKVWPTIPPTSPAQFIAEAALRQIGFTNSYTMPLPAGLVAGDLILLLWQAAGYNNLGVNLPAGYTLVSSASGTNDNYLVCWKIATGSETEIIVTTSASHSRLATSITLWRTASFGNFAATLSTSSNKNPPPVNAIDTGQVHCSMFNNSTSTTATITAIPSGYTDINYIGGGNTHTIRTTRKVISVTGTEDPGSFIAATIVDNRIVTMSIDPA